MNLENFNLLEESKNSIGIFREERTFNTKTFKMLNNKRKNLDSQFKNFLKEKNLLSYYIFNPIRLDLNSNNKFKIHKKDLHNFFIQSKENKLHKEIYDTSLYNLINPYYLVMEKKYLKTRNVYREILDTFSQEKERLKERENSILNNKFYDKNKKIYFELPPKDHQLNKISNDKMLNEAVKNHCVIVKIKNEDDDFKKILLLRPEFTVYELISLIQFIYKVTRSIIINKINLYYNNNLYSAVPINDMEKTMKGLAKEMNSELEIEILIQIQ